MNVEVFLKADLFGDGSDKKTASRSIGLISPARLLLQDLLNRIEFSKRLTIPGVISVVCLVLRIPPK